MIFKDGKINEAALICFKAKFKNKTNSDIFWKRSSVNDFSELIMQVESK